ncbi:DUF1127 domain-containing protein [Ruegeria hyattellae]|uniref:DUF1127 domain-containing protein n=1 Tax=Ruegeria hyattellae TaxID=3233337 RepID=UPI00355C5100
MFNSPTENRTPHIRRCVDWLRLLQRRHRDAQHLRRLPSYLLADLGITRDEIDKVVSAQSDRQQDREGSNPFKTQKVPT